MALRQTGVTGYRRFVVATIIAALRDAFDQGYNRDQQLQDLHIVDKHPFVKTEYPAIVVGFVDRRVSNAGIGHEEWFTDEQGVLRKWHHSRFEGAINLDLYALSTLDRDLLADATIEIIRFGRLDAQLLRFFTEIYGNPNTGVQFLLNQLMLNSDEIDGRGDSSTIAPWQPEDQLVYMTGYTLEAHGGFYNTTITDTFEYVTNVEVDPYLEGDVPILIDVPGAPFNTTMTNYDQGSIRATGTPTSVET